MVLPMNLCFVFTGDRLNVKWSIHGNTVHDGYFSLDWLKENDYSNLKANCNNKPLVAVSNAHAHMHTHTHTEREREREREYTVIHDNKMSAEFTPSV